MFGCCVSTCKNNNSTAKMFRFPYLDEAVFNIWLERIGNNKLKKLHPEMVYKNYRICIAHFAPFCIHNIQSKKPLIRGSLPTINLPGFCEEPSKDNSFMFVKPTSESTTIEHTNIQNKGLLSSGTSDFNVVQDLQESVAGPSNMLPKKRKGDHDENKTDKIVVTPKKNSRMQTYSTPKKRKDLYKRFNLLHSISVKNRNELSPRKQKLYRVAKSLRQISLQLDRECASVKTRLKRATDFTITEEFLRSTLNKTSFNFIMSQLRLQKVKPKGRRFSEEDKIFALTLFKNSSRNYSLLQKVFALPSRATLRGMLRKIPLKCGINQQLMASFQKIVRKMEKDDRMCTIIFDEMAISPSLSYNIKYDVIEGFEDMGNERRLKFANHVLVFMARGIRRKWKQPIAFYFVESAAKRGDLMAIIKSVIKACQEIGLDVMATVCDQHSTNRAALNDLLRETKATYIRRNEEKRNFGFEVNGQEIIPFFDPPHLLKGIRNNLLKGDCFFKWHEKIQKASWKVIQDVYEWDAPTASDYKLFYSLSDEHIYEAKMKKMKVIIAAQVLSQRMASHIHFLVTIGLQPPEAEGTAEFALFVDKLFDSVNGSRIEPEKGKYLRVAVTEKSRHHEFWIDALKVLNSIKFEKSPSGNPPSVVNWVHTIKAFQAMWKKLKDKNIIFFSPRHINQDPLENFFCKIRSQGALNTNPTCTQFRQSYMSLIINNFQGVHSTQANCEEDESSGVLDNLQSFLKSPAPAPNDVNQQFPELELLAVPNEKEYIDHYVAGFVAKKLLKKIGICSDCRQALISPDQSDEVYRLIRTKAYSSKALLYPSTIFSKIFIKYSYNFKHYLDKFCLLNNISLILKQLYDDHDFCTFTCKKHSIKDIFCEYFTKFYIFVWTNNINKTLKGKDMRAKKDNYGNIRLLAHNYFTKHQKFKNQTK